jgi:hypothetical protein
MFKKNNNDVRDKFIQTAQTYLGYTSNLHGSTIFGAKTGYNGVQHPWDGSFIDVVAREADVDLTACVNTPTALARFLKQNRFYLTPRPGDIVFFETSAMASEFGPPHVGIVIDASRYEGLGIFTTIEGQTSSGLPRGSRDSNGVYQRVRDNLEVIGFGRPEFYVPLRTVIETVLNKKLEGPVPGDKLPTVTPAQVHPTMRHKSVVVLQQALTKATDVDKFKRGTMCPRTKAAFAYFQRTIGYLPADGVPTFATLQRLAKETSYFIAGE